MTRLEFERRRRGWNQVSLAYHARLGQGDISMIERRRLMPTPRIVARLAQAVDVQPESLLDEVTATGETEPLRAQ